MNNTTIQYGAGAIVCDGYGSVLLCKHRDGWTSFGGKNEVNETPIETMIREVSEESLYVVDVAKVEAAVKEQEPFKLRTPSGKLFYMFIVTYPQDKKISKTFKSNRESKKFANCSGCNEMLDMRWFLWEDLCNVTLRNSFVKDLIFLSQINILCLNSDIASKLVQKNQIYASRKMSSGKRQYFRYAKQHRKYEKDFKNELFKR